MRRFFLTAGIALCLTGPGRAAVIQIDPMQDGAEPSMSPSITADPSHALADALAALNAGRIDDAVAATQAAIIRFGESANAQELLGAGLALQGHIEAAQQAFRRAIAINPRQAGAFAKLADIDLARGDDAAALSNLQTALALDPNDRRVHQRLGLIAKRRGDTVAAITHLERGIEGAPPGYVGVKLDLGVLYNAEGRFAETVSMLAGLSDRPGFDAAAWLVLGAAQLGVGDKAAAMDAAERAMALRPADPAVLQAYAVARRAALGSAGTQASFEDLVLPGRSATVATYDLVGTRLLVTGETARADAVFRAMVGRFPALAAAQFRYGTYLASVQRYDRAAEALARAARLDPREASIARAQALAASRAGDPASAVRHAERMIGLIANPTAEDRFLLASLRHEAGDLNGAEREYRQILSRGPFAPALNNLANIQAARNDLPGAQRLAQQAVALAPDAPWAGSTLGWVQFRRGDLAAAEQTLDKAIAIAPNDPTLLYYVAELRNAQGRPEEARSLLQRALSLGPFGEQQRARALAARLG